MGPILTDRQGGVRILTLNRPDVRNALSRDLRGALHEALGEAADDDATRAVVLTGAGDAFCAGLDLRELESTVEASAEANRADSRALADLLLRLAMLPKPVVAAVNGPAVAGGAGLVGACDVAVMSEDARIGYTEARIGFVAALVSVFLVRQVGEKHARDLLLSARLVSAAEAAAMGLVNEVCPAGTALDAAVARARQLAANAPSSLAMTKALLASMPTLSVEDGLRYAVEVNALARETDDLREGVRAFLDKREPRWRR
ncbi:MAG TPA: enoyl-CoA hydratase/isomerase family protein [Trueperaceae bacterium]|nr:enoyl-CoA hydratase/isomerase family protein [Trueperaceae bacterium]